MSELDGTDRVQLGIKAFARMMRPPLPDVDDPEATAKITARVEAAGAELAALGLTRSELEDVQMLYFQGHDAFRNIEDEQVVRYAYLATHAPGMTTLDAIASLTDEQLAEFNSLTAEDH